MVTKEKAKPRAKAKPKVKKEKACTCGVCTKASAKSGKMIEKAKAKCKNR